ncbi:parallel beta-helix repeat-containing protein [Altererythrobacter xiamenensis]|uniref:Parallel beta-helix repeat-containing protein n=1 Tax=Altererythrobacter xiamenensis TaxID=1316679 RepID=A0A1Y6EDP6_9SPHN|nr:parallel beta-helix domain-containing protein [Altererythrobacter xiamenensis]SMQ60685.1 parallel beta-helix repeat-containing protein [Altererythrobacter xiamenensis]
MIRLSIAALALASTSPLFAATYEVAAGEGAQERLQEALILAEPGDEIVLGAGRFDLSDGLSLDVDNVTVRGAGMDATVLDFTGQQGAGEGLLITSDDVTVRDFAMENPKGDGIKSKGADNIVYHKVRVTWTGGPKPTNGAYGIYPVESTGVLVDGAEVSGASDAGIYVGQSRLITVRNSVATDNVAGIEIENSRDAIVERNFVTRNTGGILVFDLPSLPVMCGGNVIVKNNLVVGNTTPNFAPPGNIVAGVKRGTGIMVMANEKVWINDNIVRDNPTAPFMVIAYTQAFDDPRYNPFPREVVIAENLVDAGGKDPQFEQADALLAAFGGALPPIMWDGLSQDEETPALLATPMIAGWTLNLTEQGQSVDAAQPAPLDAPAYGQPWDFGEIGAPAALEARLK